jgi:hypothetical protein
MMSSIGADCDLSLRPSRARAPRMLNQVPAHLEQRILVFCLAFQGLGPRRVAAELARERWVGFGSRPTATTPFVSS